LTKQEKQQLGDDIRSLPPELLTGVWEIVSAALPTYQHASELEFDIDNLPVKTTRLLQKYVQQKKE